MDNTLQSFHSLLISIAAINVIGLVTVLMIGIKRERNNKKQSLLTKTP